MQQTAACWTFEVVISRLICLTRKKIYGKANSTLAYHYQLKKTIGDRDKTSDGGYPSPTPPLHCTYRVYAFYAGAISIFIVSCRIA